MAAPMQNALALRNLYNRIELGGGNVWTFLLLEGISMTANELANRPLSEATLRFSIPTSEWGNLNGFNGFDDFNSDRFYSDPNREYGDQGFIKFKARNLFSNLIFGDKIGYISDNMSSFNFCIYGAAYYNIQQLKLMYSDEDYFALNTQRFQAGGGLMMVFGSIESKGRFIIDGGVRYNIPTYFGCEDYDGKMSDILNGGISSHYMIKYSWDNAVAVGFTADLMHYNLFKDNDLCGNQSKIFEIGITVAILLRNL